MAVNYPVLLVRFSFCNVQFYLFDYVLVWSNLCELGCAFYAACEYVSCNSSWTTSIGALGQIGGICLRSVDNGISNEFSVRYFLLLPKIEWSNEWGKLLRTAATTNALSQYQSSVVHLLVTFFQNIHRLQLMVLEILVCTLYLYIYVGVLMFLLSLYMNKIIAVAGGLALAIALFPVLNMHPINQVINWQNLYLPIWAELARIATVDHTYYWLPSLTYIWYWIPISGDLAIMTGYYYVIKIRHVEFNWDNEDM